MGNINRACDWPQCSCKTEQNEPCKHDDPDFHIRKAAQAASAAPPPDAARQEAEEVTAALQVSTIDLTPTWESLLPAYLTAYRHATPEVRAAVEVELRRMARIADAHVAFKKESK